MINIKDKIKDKKTKILDFLRSEKIDESSVQTEVIYDRDKASKNQKQDREYKIRKISSIGEENDVNDNKNNSFAEEGKFGFSFTMGESISRNRKITGIVFLIVFMILLFVFTELTSIDIFFWLFFVAMFWFRLDSRVSILGALIGLVVIMFFSFGQGLKWWDADGLMEQIAVSVYFFLVIGVIKQIWEYYIESKAQK